MRLWRRASSKERAGIGRAWARALPRMLLGGVQLISIGVLGEYLSRVFTEVKGRPGFIIAEDFSVDREHL